MASNVNEKKLEQALSGKTKHGSGFKFMITVGLLLMIAVLIIFIYGTAHYHAWWLLLPMFGVLIIFRQLWSVATELWRNG